MLKNVKSELILRVEAKLAVFHYNNDHNQVAYVSGLDTSKYYWVKSRVLVKVPLKGQVIWSISDTGIIIWSLEASWYLSLTAP